MANPGQAILRALSRATSGLRGDLPRRQKIEIVVCGVGLTLLVLAAEICGLLGPLENFLYDRRANDCQIFSQPPTDRIHHLDIDDKALAAVGKWPWPRTTFARLMDEVALASPRLVAVDVIYAEEETFVTKDAAGREIRRPTGGDEALTDAFARLGNVNLPFSLELAPRWSTSTFDSAIIAILTANPELTPNQLRTQLRARGFTTADYGTAYEDLFLASRKRAMYERLRHEMAEAPDVTPEALVAKVLPGTDPALSSPLMRLLHEEHARLKAVREAARFGAPRPPDLPRPIPTMANVVPLTGMARVAAAGGFVDFEILPDPTVRLLPVLVEQEGRLFPQWGFSIALQMLGADLSRLRYERGRLVVPHPGGEIAVPVRTYESQTLRREAPLLFYVPFFGNPQWETMYDPRRRGTTAHTSLAFVWDILQTQEKIERNNRAVDEAVLAILGEEGLDLDNRLAAKHQANLPPPADATARLPIVGETLKALDESQWLEQFKQFKEEELDADLRHRRDVLVASQRALVTAREQNPALQDQLIALRQQFASSIKDKAVLIGMTATAGQDTAPTPLHLRCPGVVIHGIVANAALTGQWWHVAPRWLAPACTLILGGLTAVACGWFRPGQAAIAAGTVAIGYLVVNGVVLFDYFDLVVSAAGPLVAVTATWAGCTLLRLILEGFERIRVAKDLAIFRHEMELARSVQQALIPKEAPEIAGLEPHGWTKPADLTGGDCFDLWKLPDGRLGIFLADASGHGLAPSMIVSQVRALVRILCETEAEPDNVLARVNARVADDVEAGRFATAFLGFLAADGTLTYSSAGHGPVLWCSEAAGQMLELDSSGLPLGVMGEWLGAPQPPVTLATSGMLIVFSDGIFEAPNPTGEQFGVERVLEILKDKCGSGATSGEIVAAMREAVTKWQGQDAPADDQTTVVVRKLAVPSPTTGENPDLVATGASPEA